MRINLVPDSSIASAPPGLTAAVQAAAAVYDQDFPGNYTINISYGWGTFDNSQQSELTEPNSGVYSLGGGTATTVGYSQLKSVADRQRDFEQPDCGRFDPTREQRFSPGRRQHFLHQLCGGDSARRLYWRRRGA